MGHPTIPEHTEGWSKVHTDYLVSVKREKWIPIRYVRMGDGRGFNSVNADIKHLECVADLDSPVMKVYRLSDVFVQKLSPM